MSGPTLPEDRRACRITGCIGCVALLVGLAAWVEFGDATRLDLEVNAALAPYRRPWPLAAFLWITIFGTEAAVFGMALAASALLWGEGRAKQLLPLWSTVLGAEATTWTLKFLLARPRPEFLPGVATALSPSFPSAHSTGTVALVGSLACLVARGHRGRHRQGAIMAVAVAIVLLIGFSRIFLGVHYLTDVLAGGLVGGLWLLIGSASAGAAHPVGHEDRRSPGGTDG